MFFVFFKQKTAYELRISDWSSDVCSSDLPEGLTPSVLADQLDVARNSLSFHLKELAHAGLVTIEQQGRNLIYRADFAQMNSLLGYMTEHCCQGGVCEVTESQIGRAHV